MIPIKFLRLADRPCPICRHRHKEYTEIIDTRILSCEPEGVVTNCIHCKHVDYYCDARTMKRLQLPDADGLRLGRTIIIDPHVPIGYRYAEGPWRHRIPIKGKTGIVPYENIHPQELDFKLTIEDREEERYR